MPLLFFAARFVRHPGHTELPHYFHRGMCWILGLHVTYSGEISRDKPTLYVSNHISYLDVFVLGDVRAYFIAKSEVAGWPVLGQYAKFQNTLFIERKAGTARQQLEVLKQHLLEGNSLILFPEGTSTDGAHVEPFKSSLFESVKLGESPPRVTIQPVTVTYTRYAGQKMDQTLRDYYAWYGTTPFGPHALNLLPLKKVDVKVHFHPVCYLEQFATRKQCADHCQKLVAEKMHQFLHEA